MLFGNAIPIHEEYGVFSFAWAGNYPGESMFESHNIMTESKNLFEGRDRIHAMGVWNSVPINLVVADTSGNIGYMLLSASPQRKNEYPYLGCHILDGTTSEHDWEGIVDVKTLPRGFNPEKGYYVTANQRIVPENSKFDIASEPRWLITADLSVSISS